MNRIKTNLNRITLVAAIIAVTIVGNTWTAVGMAQVADAPAKQETKVEVTKVQVTDTPAKQVTKVEVQTPPSAAPNTDPIAKPADPKAQVQVQQPPQAAHDADLKAKLAEQKAQLDEAHNAKLAEQKTKIEDALKAAHDADLKAKLAEQKAQLDEAHNAKLAEQKTKIEDALKAAHDSDLKAKLAEQKSQIEAPFKAAHDAEIKRLNDAHSSALKKLEDEKNALATKVADLSRENGRLESSYQNLNSQFTSLNTTHNDFKADMVDRLESIRKEREATLLKIAEVGGLITTLQTQLQAMNDIAAGFKAKNEAQTAEAKRIDGLVKEYKAAEIAQLAKMQELQTKLKEIETNYQDNINKNKGRSRNA